MKQGYTVRVEVDGHTVEYELPRVTTIIETVWSSSFSSAAYWGYHMAIEALRPKTADKARAMLKANGDSPDDRRDARAEEGTGAHEYFHTLAKGEMPVVLREGGPALMAVPGPGKPQERFSERVWSQYSPYAQAVASFWQRDMPGNKVLATESRVYSLKNWYAGTVDLVVENPMTGLSVVDLKTRPRLDVRPKDAIQVAAYAVAWQELFGTPVDAGYVLLAGLDGQYRLSRPINFKKYVPAWHGTLVAYHALHGYGRGV